MRYHGVKFFGESPTEDAWISVKFSVRETKGAPESEASQEETF